MVFLKYKVRHYCNNIAWHCHDLVVRWRHLFSYIKYILLVRHLGFVCVLLYIARSGLLQLRPILSLKSDQDQKSTKFVNLVFYFRVKHAWSFWISREREIILDILRDAWKGQFFLRDWVLWSEKVTSIVRILSLSFIWFG